MASEPPASGRSPRRPRKSIEIMEREYIKRPVRIMGIAIWAMAMASVTSRERWDLGDGVLGGSFGRKGWKKSVSIILDIVHFVNTFGHHFKMVERGDCRLEKSKRKGVILKVDFEKAYDSVNWPFLLETLKGMGFGLKRQRWILACLSSSTTPVLVNGSLTNEFSMEKGLRQGDPLAPFLFQIVAKCLHVMLKEAEDKGLIKGIKVGKKKVPISHLQYTDDVILFGEWDPGNLKILIKVLEKVSSSVLEWNWRRPPRGREVGEVERLKLALEGHAPKLRGWIRCFGRMTRVASSRKLIEVVGVREVENGSQNLWLNAVPKKIWIFNWRVNLGRLPVRVELDKRVIDLNSVLCPRCESAKETVDHALFGCDKVEEGGWRWFGASCTVWLNRNKIVFEQKNVPLEETFFNF
ncbi:hypothetical protein OSB04_017253 [Centaurea solstitialis]|uniref:Reverse transcriptase domain-containing protein n=1 Tax=Centaurea solstitialis TaxID=347529 RepID=A0AA38TMK0_9ASTR|nr:hypothetical protein OSB04_017253 [Centaurea solstitialis]